MKASNRIILLSSLIVILSFIASALGVFWQGRESHSEFKTLRGETVIIQGSGLYKYDSVSIAAQGISQDVVTLIVGIPLLVISILLFNKGSVRGNLLLTGTLGYFLYTYATYAFGASYNILFLLYTALFSIGLFAFVLSIMTIEIEKLPSQFSEKLPRKTISIFLFIVGTFLLLAWLGRIVPSLTRDAIPLGLESYTTLVIQVMDLGIVVPLAFLSGILLLKRTPYGYLLSSIVLIKGFTLTIAVSAMVVGQILAGVKVQFFEVIIFPTLTSIGIILTLVLLKNISKEQSSE